MNKLTQEETARIFAMYYGANVSIQGCDEIQAIVALNACQIYTDDEDEIGFDDCRLVLTPLSAITDEHAIELATVSKYDKNPDPAVKLIVGKDIISRILDGRFPTFPWETYQLLTSRGYALPLWIGIDHWANGKTAIELNVAIDSTTLNNTDNGKV